MSNIHRVVVIGASGGIGDAFITALLQRHVELRIFAVSRAPLAFKDERVTWLPMSFDDETSIMNCANSISASGAVNRVIVATGLLHDEGDISPEKSYQQITSAAMQRVFMVNTIGPALCIKHFLPMLSTNQGSVFSILSARVGSISDNALGGWHSYRASKAALNMLIKNTAIELKRTNKHASIIGLHPGTVDTLLSKPFQRNVKPNGLFSTEQSANYLLNVIDDIDESRTGSVIDWNNKTVPA